MRVFGKLIFFLVFVFAPVRLEALGEANLWETFFTRSVPFLEIVTGEEYDEVQDNLQSLGDSYELEFVIGRRGKGLGELLLPVDVKFHDGSLFVVDYGNERIQRFAMNGQAQEVLTFPGLIKPIEMQFFGKFIYIVDQGDSTIKVYSHDRQLLTRLGKRGVDQGDLNLPVALAVDSKGLVWVSDEKGNRIVVYTMQQLYGRDDHYFMAIDEYLPNEYLRAPRSLLYIPDHNEIFVIDSGTARILSFDQYGNFIGPVTLKSGEAKRVIMPQALTMDSKANFYLSDDISHRVLKYDGQGNPMGEIGAEGQFPTFLARQPEVGADGKPLVTVPAGPLLLKVGDFDPGDSLMSFPHHLHVNDGGDLFVCDWGNNQIKKFTRSFYRKAVDLYKIRRFNLALEYFKRCNPTNPRHHLVEFYVAMCHYYLGESEASFENKLERFEHARVFLEALKLKDEIGKYQNRWIRDKALYYLSRVRSYHLED